METLAKQSVCNDTSACYEDYTLNLDEEVAKTEQPTYKKRKLHTEEKVIQENIVKEKPILANHKNTAVNEKVPQDKQENSNLQYHQDSSTLTNHIQSPNLSDSDSNDILPAGISSNGNMSVQHSQYIQF